MNAHFSAKKPGWLVLRSGAQLSHGTLFWMLQSTGWLLFGLMMLGYELIWQKLVPAIVDDALSVTVGFVLTTGFRALYRGCRRAGLRPATMVIIAVALCLLGSPAWYLIQVYVGEPLLMDSPSEPDWNMAGVVLYYLFILATWNLLYFGAQGWISLGLERRRAERAEAMAQSARLRALQSQLEPHFLFNTLNGISSLVVARQSEAAATMIGLLSDFLRLTLKAGGTPEITVQDELGFVNHYLDIQKLRFGPRLSFDVQSAPEALLAMVPTLLLQPMVENALKHGILHRAGGGRVVVDVRTDGDKLQLRVEDDGPGLSGSPMAGAGVGLSNTATRLHELYGSEATLYVGRSQLGGVVVDIKVPLLFSSARIDAQAIEA
jgi:two-component system, LytTR family, sensor kinase